MLRIRRTVACAVGLGLIYGAAYSPSSGGTPARKLRQVHVVVDGWYAFVKATLIDREGRREGWNVDRPIFGIPGCNFGYGSEEGTPDENAPEDTTKLAPADTIPGHPEPTPM